MSGSDGGASAGAGTGAGASGAGESAGESARASARAGAGESASSSPRFVTVRDARTGRASTLDLTLPILPGPLAARRGDGGREPPPAWLSTAFDGLAPFLDEPELLALARVSWGVRATVALHPRWRSTPSGRLLEALAAARGVSPAPPRSPAPAAAHAASEADRRAAASERRAGAAHAARALAGARAAADAAWAALDARALRVVGGARVARGCLGGGWGWAWNPPATAAELAAAEAGLGLRLPRPLLAALAARNGQPPSAPPEERAVFGARLLAAAELPAAREAMLAVAPRGQVDLRGGAWAADGWGSGADGGHTPAGAGAGGGGGGARSSGPRARALADYLIVVTEPFDARVLAVDASSEARGAVFLVEGARARLVATDFIALLRAAADG